MFLSATFALLSLYEWLSAITRFLRPHKGIRRIYRKCRLYNLSEKSVYLHPKGGTRLQNISQSSTAVQIKQNIIIQTMLGKLE